jgi:hypothetical protein
MGNDARRGPNQPRDERRDDGWGRPLGHGTQRVTDTWMPRTVDSWAPGDRHRTDSQRRKSTKRERSREQNVRTQEQNVRTRDEQRHDNRSRSRGRTTQQQSQKDKDPNQRSLIDWMPINNTSRERSRRGNSATRGRQTETESRPIHTNRK